MDSPSQTTATNPKSPKVRPGKTTIVFRVVVALLVVLALGAVFIDFPSPDTSAPFFSGQRPSPSLVELNVGGCAREPRLYEFDETSPGTYEVRVRFTTPPNDCAAIDPPVTIDVDPNQEIVTVIDRWSGTVLELETSPVN